MNGVLAPVPPTRTTASRYTASKYSSNLARSWRPSASPNSLDHGLQVHLQTRSITASKCISKLARYWPPSSLDYGLQFRSITASKCISKLARSRPRSASLSLFVLFILYAL